MSAAIDFRGQVTSGRGKATADLLSLRDDLLPIVNELLCPGSLNVLLNRPVRLRDSAASAFDGGRRMLWRASLNGIDIWVYRWEGAPLHVAEVLSSVHLRQRLDLKDGDEINLRLSSDLIAAITPLGVLTWIALWIGRRSWFYSSNSYYNRTLSWGKDLGAAQKAPIVKGTAQMTMYIIKRIVKRTPLMNTLARSVISKLSGPAGKRKTYVFSRFETNDCANADERQFLQIRNLLNFTKTSNSVYAAHMFPAAYHTMNIGGQQLAGQRDPSRRLALVPVDFRGKTILDLGCNQGGMIHHIAGLVKWAVGLDYDPHMINAANRIKAANGASNTSFYVLDLQRDPLELIYDFLPDRQVDVCFLLSVCMWLDNWKQVIDFAQSTSGSMLFESNGSPAQQDQQFAHLRTKYGSVELLSETSEDDPSQRQRRLFYLSDPILPVSRLLKKSVALGDEARDVRIVDEYVSQEASGSPKAAHPRPQRGSPSSKPCHVNSGEAARSRVP